MIESANGFYFNESIIITMRSFEQLGFTLLDDESLSPLSSGRENKEKKMNDKLNRYSIFNANIKSLHHKATIVTIS